MTRALFAAADGGHLDIIKFLLQKGVTIPEDIVRHAIDKGHAHVAELIRNELQNRETNASRSGEQLTTSLKSPYF